MRALNIALVIGFVSVTVLTADTIELWGGTTLTDVEIVGIKEGSLTYKSNGELEELAVIKVRNVLPGNLNYQIVRFVDYVYNKRPVKLLTIRVQESEKDRIQRPLVRLFSCSKSKRGSYEITLSVNTRISDPTNVGKLDEVVSVDFLNRHYVLKKPDGVAYRVEIWQSGLLMVAQDYDNDDGLLPSEWYRKLPVKSHRSLKVADDIIDEEAMVVLEEAKIEKAVEKGWRIDSVSVLPEVIDTVPRLKVDYSVLNKTKNSALLPKVIFYYVTENSSGDKEIASTKVTGAGKKVTLIDGRYKGSVKKRLQKKIRLTQLEVKRGDGLVQLIHWRVELVRGDAVLSFKEKKGRHSAQLPAEWWK